MGFLTLLTMREGASTREPQSLVIYNHAHMCSVPRRGVDARIDLETGTIAVILIAQADADTNLTYDILD